MRAEDEACVLSPTAKKNDIIQMGKNAVIDAVNAGDVDKHELAAKIARLKEFITAADAEIRQHLPAKKITAFGVEFAHVDGGYTLNYDEDEIYQQLKADLKAREELLKIAQSQSVFDGYGNPVPMVGKTPKKSYLTLKF